MMRSRLLLLLTLSLLVACDTQEVRTGYPRFDATQPFDELASESSEGNGSKENNKPSGASAFERAIAREQAGNTNETPTSKAAQGRAIRRISLGDVFVAEVPARYDEWTFASESGTTMLTHQLPGQPADAIVYIEAFSPATRYFPSFEVGRFMYTIDPALAPNVVYPPIAGLAKTWAEEQGVPPVDMLVGLQMALTRTAGMGIGYRSDKESFTGWKWSGRSPAGVTMRLGRTYGTWGSPSMPGNTNLTQVMSQMASKSPELKPIVAHLAKQAQTSIKQGRSPSSAWMILGSMTRGSSNTGAHIAIVCVQRPVCPVSKELSQILATVKPTGTGDYVSKPNATLEKVARSVGVELLPLDKMISAPQMISKLQQALQDQRGMKIPNLPKGLPSGASEELLKNLPEGLPPEVRQAIEGAGTTPPVDGPDAGTPTNAPAGVPIPIPGQ